MKIRLNIVAFFDKNFNIICSNFHVTCSIPTHNIFQNFINHKKKSFHTKCTHFSIHIHTTHNQSTDKHGNVFIRRTYVKLASIIQNCDPFNFHN